MSVQHPLLLPMELFLCSTESDVIVTRSPKADTPITRNQPTTTSGMDDFRKVLKSEGLSKLGSDSISNYQLAWGKWDRWCYE